MNFGYIQTAEKQDCASMTEINICWVDESAFLDGALYGKLTTSFAEHGI